MLLPPLAGTVYRLSIISWLFSIPCNWLVWSPALGAFGRSRLAVTLNFTTD
jgi:hypothetical protein